MKTIENITITATYTVGFGEWEVPENIYRGLQKIEEKHHGRIDSDYGCRCKQDDEDVATAYEWLVDNIHSKDAYDWSYEIVDFEQ